jgi:competence protein ComEC
MLKVPLFLNKKEALFFFTTLFVIFCFFLGKEYLYFSKLKKSPIIYTNAKIIGLYKKHSKSHNVYYLLKLRTEDFTFYTFKRKIKNIEMNDEVNLGLVTKKITFYRYVKGFFTPTINLKLVKKHTLDSLHVKIKKQHENEQMKELFCALFFATPYSKGLRFDIAKWGISHLVAISGFHLGILSAILYFFFKPLYVFFQDKFFPYRNAHADIALIVFLCLGAYVYYINLVPSVLRAYVMSLAGFFLFANHIKFLSFQTLFTCVALILAFFPKLLFSLSFFFSVTGVFYIFLFLEHFSNLNKYTIFILLNFWVYLLMMPVVHHFFDIFSFYQFFSPILSMFFVLFYPLELFLHVINQGGVFDAWIIEFLQVPMQIYSLHVKSFSLAIYLLVSLLAVRRKSIACILPFVAIGVLFI